MITVYEHHGLPMHVKKGVKGKHRTLCLCHSCVLFDEDNAEANCEISNQIYETCVEMGVVTPVVECASFIPLKSVAVEYNDVVPFWAEEALAGS